MILNRPSKNFSLLQDSNIPETLKKLTVSCSPSLTGSVGVNLYEQVGQNVIGFLKHPFSLTYLKIDVDVYSGCGRLPMLLLNLVKNAANDTTLEELHFGTFIFTHDEMDQQARLEKEINSSSVSNSHTNIKVLNIKFMIHTTTPQSLELVSNILSFALESCPLLEKFSLESEIDYHSRVEYGQLNCSLDLRQNVHLLIIDADLNDRSYHRSHDGSFTVSPFKESEASDPNCYFNFLWHNEHRLRLF